MLEQNGIPLLAVIVESIAGIFMIALTLVAVRRLTQKRTKIALALTMVLLLFGVATFISGIGKLLDYTSKYDRLTQRSYSDLTIAIAYSLLIFSNVFFSYILSILYLKPENQLPYFLVIFNAALMGMIYPQLEPKYGLYQNLLPILVAFLLVTFFIHGLFVYYSLKESKASSEEVTKKRFRRIATFSMLIILVLIFFIIDLVLGLIQGTGYTVFYYAGWITVAVSTVFGYMGYFAR